MSNETEEQKQIRYRSWAEQQRWEIESGGCTHTSWAQKDISIGGQLMFVIEPVVRLSNDDDSYYVQTFRTRDELEEFIAELCKDADEAWGKKK
jgi:hypothetical protein